MSAEHRNDVPTATQQSQQQEQQQPTSIFSDVIAVISGARQSANQEFNNFWDKYISKKASSKDTSSSQHLPIHFTAYDLACIKERKNIQGRLIPVSNNYEDVVSPPTDKDIIRSSEKRKVSLIEDDLTSNTLPRTKVNKRHLHASNLSPSSQSSSPETASYVTPPTYLIPSPPPIFYNSPSIPSSPEKDTTVLSLPSQLLPITSSPYRRAKYINTIRTSVSPIQSPARVNTIQTSLTSTQSPVRRTAIRTSVSPIQSPARVNTIQTSLTSTQSPVRRTAIRTSVSPIQSPARVNTIKTSLTPTQSPVRRTAIRTSVSPMNYSPDRFNNPIVTGSSKSVQTLASEIASKLSPGGLSPFSPRKESNIFTVDAEDPFQSTPLAKTSNRKIAVPKTRKFIIEDEEDKRLTHLQNRINAIKSEVNEFISSPADIVSPEPIAASLESKAAALEELMLLGVDDIPEPPLPSYLALNRTPSPPPLPETIVSLPRRSFSPLPPFVPSPSRPLPTDTFNQDHVLRKNSVVTKKSTARFSPYSKAQSNVKKNLTRQNSTINVNNTSLGGSSPNKTEPPLTHKLKMRHLVHAIPFCKLRKTDTLTGPDGITRPNPFWNEIYGGRKL